MVESKTDRQTERVCLFVSLISVCLSFVRSFYRQLEVQWQFLTASSDSSLSDCNNRAHKTQKAIIDRR